MQATILSIALLVLGPQLLNLLFKSFIWRSKNQLILVTKSFFVGEVLAFAGLTAGVGTAALISSPQYPQIWILITEFFLISHILFIHTDFTLQKLFLFSLSLMVISYLIATGVFSVGTYTNYLLEVFIAGLFIGVLLRGALWQKEMT